MIRVSKLRKEYGSFLALNDISFEVPRGQVVGFLGPNGAGKSTTIKILTTYLMATAGDASLAGYSVNDEPIEVRKRVGYLPEHAPLYRDMTVFEYLNYAAQSRELGDRSTRRRAIARVMAICSLFEKAGERIDHLSKGFRQRVGLAQALIHDPEVLILDEPTSGLDPIQIQEVRRVIRRMGEDRTVIFSTHIIPEAELTSDRIIVIDRGQLIADGAPSELRERGEVREWVISWTGDENDLRTKLKDILGQGLEMRSLRPKPELLELSVRGKSLKADQGDMLAKTLSGDGHLMGLSHQTLSLEQTFFELVGRKSER